MFDKAVFTQFSMTSRKLIAGRHGWVEKPAVKKKITEWGRALANRGARRFQSAIIPCQIFGVSRWTQK